MSERITQELRRAMCIGYAVEDGEQVDAIWHGAFMDQCSAIDAIHANLERENDRLKCELDRVLGELEEMHKTDGISNNTTTFMHSGSYSIGSATITITPTLDWSRVAAGLRSIAATLDGGVE